MNRYFFFVLSVLIIHVNPLYAFYQNKNYHPEIIAGFMTQPRTQNSALGFAVLNNDWEDSCNSHRNKKLLYRSNQLNFADEIELYNFLKRKYNAPFVSTELSIADIIYSNLELKRLIDEYRGLQEERKALRGQLASVAKFEYKIDTIPSDGAPRDTISYRRQIVSDKYRQIVNQIKSHSPLVNISEDISDVSNFESVVQAIKGIYSKRVIDSSLKKSTSQTPTESASSSSGKIDQSKGTRQSRLYNEKINSLTRKGVEDLWIVSVSVKLLRYIMENKSEVAIYCFMLVFVISILSSSRPR